MKTIFSTLLAKGKYIFQIIDTRAYTYNTENNRLIFCKYQTNIFIKTYFISIRSIFFSYSFRILFTCSIFNGLFILYPAYFNFKFWFFLLSLWDLFWNTPLYKIYILNWWPKTHMSVEWQIYIAYAKSKDLRIVTPSFGGRYSVNFFFKTFVS
jgi:hypothetical protein